MEVVTLSDTYQDSVKLMRIANETRETFGVEEAVAMMGTQENKALLEDLGTIDAAALADLNPDDLVLAVVDDDRSNAQEAIEWMEAEVSGSADRDRGDDTGDRTPRSLYGALDRHPDANIGLISVPSEYAAREAWKALHEGLHVHIFSDNVDLDAERALKTYGRDHDQLVMGPDCGTAIINQAPLGFANSVDNGSIGVVSAAGSGLQEVTALLDRAGAGVSQAIGTGGRDLYDEVGGITMAHGLELLADDDETSVIVLVSKPPDSRTEESLLESVADCPKPVVVEFVGSDPEPIEAVGAIPATSLADAARRAVQETPDWDAGGGVSFVADVEGFSTPADDARIVADRGTPAPQRQHLRGLYSGGTLCSEAATILTDALPELASNVGVGEPLSDPLAPRGHAVIDLGADEFTQGRPHPMIDSGIRDDQLRDALGADDVLVVLLDVVLGYAAHDDPAAPIVDVIEDTGTGDWPVVVGSVVGTRGDPQGLVGQVEALTDAGVEVCESNAAAVQLTRNILAEATGPEVGADD